MVPYAHVQDVRSVTVSTIESKWSRNGAEPEVFEREPIATSDAVSMYPGDGNVYCYLTVGDDVISIPDFPFLIKLLHLL